MGKALAYARRNPGLAAAIALGLAARLAILLFYLATHQWQVKTWEPEAIARNLLSGQGYVFSYHGTSYKSAYVPVFPLLSAGLHALTGPGFIAYYLFQLSSAALLIWLVYACAERWFGRGAALPAAWLAAFEPGLVLYQSYTVEVTSLSALLLLASLYTFHAAKESPAPKRWLASGLLMGLGALSRPDIIAAWIAPLMNLVLERGRAAAWKAAAWTGLGIFLLVGPWALRNLLIHHRFMPFSSLPGEILWVGNNPKSTGTLWTQEGRPQIFEAPADLQARIEGGGELANLDDYHEAAVRFIAADPAAFLMRCARSFVSFWWFPPRFGAGKYYTWLPPSIFSGYKLLYGGLLLLVLLGAASALAHPSSRAVALSMTAAALGVALIHCPTYVEGRHRVLVMPILLIFAARGGVLCWTKARKT